MPDNSMPPIDEDNKIFKDILDSWIQSKHSIGPEMNGGHLNQRAITPNTSPSIGLAQGAARIVIIGALPDWSCKSEMEYQRLSKEIYLKYN